MSIRIMTKVWDHSTQKGSALLLLLALADHAADDGFCWPGIPRLAKKIRMSERSVTRILQSLEDDGELYVIRQTGQHNWYVVRVGMSNQDVIATLKERRLATPDILSPLTNSAPTPDKLSGGTDIAVSPTTDKAVSHEPSLTVIEPSKNHEPPSADSLPGDDSWPDDRPPTKPPERHTTEQVKAGVQRAVETFAKNGGRPGVADPTQDADPWEDRPVREWCAFIRLPYSEQSPGRLRLLAADLRKIATTDGLSKTPDETGAAIRTMTVSKSCQWMRSAGRPTHKEFTNVLTNVLCGQTLPEGNGRHDKGAGGQPEPTPAFEFEEPEWLGVAL